MCRGIAVTRDTGAQAHVAYLLSLLADSYWQIGQADEGLETLAEAFQLIETTGERYWEGEIYRLKGELLLIDGAIDLVEAERCFNRALKIATAQSAKSLELCSAMSLARRLPAKYCGNNDDRLVSILSGLWYLDRKYNQKCCSFIEDYPCQQQL